MPYGDINTPTRDRFDPTNPQSLRAVLERETTKAGMPAPVVPQAPDLRPVKVAPPTEFDKFQAAAQQDRDVQGPNQETMNVVMAGFLSGDPVIQKASQTYYNSRVPKKQRQRYVPVSGGVLDTSTGDITRDQEWADQQHKRALDIARQKASTRGEEWDRRFGVKQTTPKTVPASVQKHLSNQTEELDTLQGLLEGDKAAGTPGFKDEYSGGAPGWDKAQNWMGQHASAVLKLFDVPAGLFNAKPGARAIEQSVFWGNYKRFQELKQRHELFGAVLKPSEQAEWEAATINPSMQPEEIRTKLGTQKRLLEDAIKRDREEAATNYRRPDLRQTLEAATPQDDGPALRYNPATGKVE